jgi:hypothetical protein
MKLITQGGNGVTAKSVSLSFIHNFDTREKISPQRHDICARAEGRT